MSDKRIHNDQLDDFSKQIRQKMQDHRLSVDDFCWDEIDARLKSQPQKRHPIRYYIGIAATVAAVVAIALLFLPYNDNQPNTASLTLGSSIDSTIVENTGKDNAILSTDSLEESEEVIAPFIQKKKNVLIVKAKDTKVRNKQTLGSTPTIDSIFIADKGEDRTPEINEDRTNKALDSDSLPSLDNKQSPPSSDQSPKELFNREPGRLLIAKKENNDDKWLLAAAVSAGQNTLTSNGSNFNNYYAKGPEFTNSPGERDELISDLPVYTTNSEFLPPEEFSEIDHSLPLSFGLTVRKDINKRFGIETGLTYTYLSSTFRKTTTPYYQAKQELHYLGVPVNLVVYLWNDPKWNVYVSAGGMVEKGLRYKYSQDMYMNGNKISTIHDKGSIDRLQWSLNASLGISYYIHEGWGLYFEPRYSYYFDNNQPISIRTDKSHVFGLAGGFRYKF